MKKFRFIQYAFIFIMALFAYSCTPDKYELGSVLSVEDLQFEIIQDANDPNMIILTSNTPGVTPLWQTPMGRSTAVVDTVKLPFPDTYTFTYGVQSEGGYVEAETYIVEVTTTNLSYVDDPLWEALSGGVGNSKTWYLDLDADAVCRNFAGPVYYWGMNNGWNFACFGSDCWNWNPDYAGNSWIMTAMDYGSMTFSLEGGAKVMVDNKALPAKGGTGTYFLDVNPTDYKTLKFTDVQMLHDAGFDGVVLPGDWSEVRVMTLTENYMQLGVVRDAALSKEDECLLVYNFISKDYFDSWTPGEEADPEPTLPDNWEDAVSSVTSYDIKWILSEETPFNWANLDGSLMNTGWVDANSYDSWTGMDATVPDTYADFSMTMNSQTKTVKMVLPDGTTGEGTYTLDEKGIYTFDGVQPSFVICGGWVNLKTSADNQWRILQVVQDLDGNTTGMWVGVPEYNDLGVHTQYMCYLLVPEMAGGSAENVENLLVVDSSKLAFGNIEDNNDKYRIEIYNAYGATASNSPIVAADLKFSSSVSITFTISGLSFIGGAAGSYKTAMQLADADWYPQSMGDGTGSGETTITGDGTYTVKWTSTQGAFDGATVFCIDIVDLVPDLTDISAVSVVIDKIVLK
ncbi:MAG: hypothetical protein ACK5IJ_07685 [Mangrovibacterium sp.]